MSLVGKRPDLGFLTTPRRRQVFDLLAGTWAADTGCYTGTYDEGLYLEFLRRRHYAASTCLFAPAPDVVGDPVATWRLSEPVLAKIRDAGFRAALVAQDGMQLNSRCLCQVGQIFLNPPESLLGHVHDNQVAGTKPQRCFCV